MANGLGNPPGGAGSFNSPINSGFERLCAYYYYFLENIGEKYSKETILKNTLFFLTGYIIWYNL